MFFTIALWEAEWSPYTYNSFTFTENSGSHLWGPFFSLIFVQWYIIQKPEPISCSNPETRSYGYSV